MQVFTQLSGQRIDLRRRVIAPWEKGAKKAPTYRGPLSRGELLAEIEQGGAPLQVVRRQVSMAFSHLNLAVPKNLLKVVDAPAVHHLAPLSHFGISHSSLLRQLHLPSDFVKEHNRANSLALSRVSFFKAK